MNKVKALQSLRPGAKWVLRGDNLEWLDIDQRQPTENEIKTEISRLQDEYDAKEYQRQRAKEYPPLTDLADAMYWSSQGDNTKLEAYYAACEAVKLKYPKATNE
jgi:hypothetical protein